MSNQPVAKFKDRGLEVSIWENSNDQDKWYSVNMERSYKDDADKWQKTTSLNKSDIPRAMALYQLAYAKIHELESE